MGEYEPEDSRNVTGTASTQDGRWTGQAANDPTRQDQQQAGQQQGGQSGQQRAPQQSMGGSQGEIGQANDGVSDASNQGNDHTSAISQGSGQTSSQPQQFQNTIGQQGGGQQGDNRFADQLQKHQEVVDSAGQHVGTVDHVDGDRIKLTRKDSPDGEHHYVALRDVAGIEGGKVRLSTSGGATSGGATGGQAR